MTTLSLLTTKFHIPTPSLDLVPRPRLIERLEAGLRGRLILISAPPGFGKTTLVSAWVSERIKDEGEGIKKEGASVHPGIDFAWLSLNESDSTPTVFWAYVIAALQTVDPQIGKAALSAFQSPQPPPIESVLVSLINDLASLSQDAVLVLDDYHAVSYPEIHTALAFFLDHLPQNLHLVITTREDPPLPLSRLRARGQLTEIRAADLRFSAAETDTFLNRLMALDLPAEDVAALAQRTEGWAAGLRLAALSLQEEADRHAFIDAFTASHRFLTDYLVDEVLSRQEPAVRRFMLRTSILRRFTAALCDSVNGETSGQQTLRRLEQANLFLVPLDGARTWYRYHHLFAQFLRLHLQEAEPELIPELYRRAMDWCAAQGLEREALEYALEARDQSRAAQFIETIASGVLSREGPTPVLEWMKALPEALVRRRPRLCVQTAWALTFTGKMEDAAGYLDSAEAACRALPEGDEKAAILGYVAAHRAYLRFFQGDGPQAMRQAREAMARLPAEDDVMRARTAAILGNCCRYAGETQAAVEAFSLAAVASEKTGNIYTANFNYCSLAELYLDQGKLHQAVATYRQSLDFARRRAGRPDVPFTGFAYIAIGRTHLEWNDLAHAAGHLDTGIRLCREWRQAESLAIGLMELARLHHDRGEYEAARQALDEARRIAQDSSSAWGADMVDAFQVRLDLAQGNLAAASRWAQASGLSIHDQPGFERSVEYHTLARVLMAEGKYDDALVLLDRLVRRDRAAGRNGLVLAELVWQARACAGLGDRAGAHAALNKALEIGLAENYVHSFLEAGQTIADLLRQMPPGEYRDRLLAAFPQSEVTPPQPPAPATLPEPLNNRELDVLRLMAAGLSNREIGAELYLSENTIRWYASQIYLKLGVSGRGAAVAHAREAGVI